MRSKWLWSIVALGLAARLALLACAWDRPEGVFTPDSRDYWQLARSLDERGCFAMDPDGRWPEIFRTPGYPAYLAFWQAWHWGVAATAWRAALLAQILLDCSLIVLTFLLGRGIAGQRAGLVAAGFQAFTPLAVASSCRILSDSIFAFMLTLAVVLIFRHFRATRQQLLARRGEGPASREELDKGGLPVECGGKVPKGRDAALASSGLTAGERAALDSPGAGASQSGVVAAALQRTVSFTGPNQLGQRTAGPWQVWWPLLAAAVVLGLSCYVRPVGIILAAVFFTVLTAGHHGFRRAGAFALIVIAICAPWVVRNSYVADYRGFSSFATDSYCKYAASRLHLPSEYRWLYETHQKLHAGGRGTSVATSQDNSSISYGLLGVWQDAIWHEYGFDLGPNERWKTPGEAARYRMEVDINAIKGHPLEALEIHLKGDLAFWLPDASEVLEVAGLATGGRGTLNLLHEQGLWPAVRHYFGDNRTAIAVAIPLTAVFAVKMLGVVACIIRRFRIRMPLEVWLMAMLVIVSALLPGPAAHPRFRVPIEPILSVAAAVGWLAVFRRRA
ncbi:MAG: hypothetical protein ACE15C_12715 [Phycisphaerae bacterium]